MIPIIRMKWFVLIVDTKIPTAKSICASIRQMAKRNAVVAAKHLCGVLILACPILRAKKDVNRQVAIFGGDYIEFFSLKRRHKELQGERRKDALDGQSALEERDTLILRLQAEYNKERDKVRRLEDEIAASEQSRLDLLADERRAQIEWKNEHQRRLESEKNCIEICKHLQDKNRQLQAEAADKSKAIVLYVTLIQDIANDREFWDKESILAAIGNDIPEAYDKLRAKYKAAEAVAEAAGTIKADLQGNADSRLCGASFIMIEKTRIDALLDALAAYSESKGGAV